MCSQPLSSPTTRFIAWGSGSLMFESARQSPTPPAAIITPTASTISVTMPPRLASENVSAPAQPPSTKFASEKPGATTPMKTSSSKMATSVTTNSTLAAMCMPTMFSVMNTR